MDIPPSFPTFTLIALMSIVTTLKLLTRRPQHILPLLPVHVIGNLITTIVILSSTLPNKGAGFLARLFGPYNRRNVGIDVYGLLRMNRRGFWYTTGETPESFDAIVQRIAANVTLPSHTPRVPTTN